MKPKNFFNKMQMMRKILKIDLDGNKKGLRTCDKDKVIVVTGGEGLGKSNIVQCMFDIWYEEILKDENYSEEYIRYFGSNKEEFLDALKYCSDNNQKYMMLAHDEAAKDLYSRKAMSSFSADLNIAYQVIRGLNLYTILIIPNVLDLDSFFRNRRLTGMIHVFNIDYKNKETQFAYYNKKKLDELIPEMKRMAERQSNPDPFKCSVKPLFYDTAPLYSGVLKKAYEERKRDNMASTITDLYGKHVSPELKVKNGKKPNLQDAKLPAHKYNSDKFAELFEKGYTYKQIGERFSVSHQTAIRGVRWYLQDICTTKEVERINEARRQAIKAKKAKKNEK